MELGVSVRVCGFGASMKTSHSGMDTRGLSTHPGPRFWKSVAVLGSLLNLGGAHSVTWLEDVRSGEHRSAAARLMRATSKRN